MPDGESDAGNDDAGTPVNYHSNDDSGAFYASGELDGLDLSPEVNPGDRYELNTHEVLDLEAMSEAREGCGYRYENKSRGGNNSQYKHNRRKVFNDRLKEAIRTGSGLEELLLSSRKTGDSLEGVLVSSQEGLDPDDFADFSSVIIIHNDVDDPDKVEFFFEVRKPGYLNGIYGNHLSLVGGHKRRGDKGDLYTALREGGEELSTEKSREMLVKYIDQEPFAVTHNETMTLTGTREEYREVIFQLKIPDGEEWENFKRAIHPSHDSWYKVIVPLNELADYKFIYAQPMAIRSYVQKTFNVNLPIADDTRSRVLSPDWIAQTQSKPPASHSQYMPSSYSVGAMRKAA